MGDDELLLSNVTHKLFSVFEGTNLRPVEWYLGVTRTTDSSFCDLTQNAYITELTTEFKFSGPTSAVNTAMFPSFLTS